VETAIAIRGDIRAVVTIEAHLTATTAAGIIVAIPTATGLPAAFDLTSASPTEADRATDSAIRIRAAIHTRETFTDRRSIAIELFTASLCM